MIFITIYIFVYNTKCCMSQKNIDPKMTDVFHSEKNSITTKQYYLERKKKCEEKISDTHVYRDSNSLFEIKNKYINISIGI